MMYVLFGQCQNLRLMSFLVLKLYLIDTVLGSTDVSKKELDQKTILLGILFGGIVVPQLIASVVQVRRCSFRVGGLCRLKLQANLLRKFLNYAEGVRSAVHFSDLIVSITHHSPDLVQHGYISMLDLLQEVGKMV